MALIKSLSIRNFRCYRNAISIDFSEATYIVGANNSGKTAVLNALKCFFDSTAYKSDYLNKTEFTSKQVGYNRSDITVVFDLEQVIGKTRRSRMIKNYGNLLTLRKSFIYREASDTLVVQYTIDGNTYDWDTLDRDIRDVVIAVALSYLHPQEGPELLKRAQEKLKQRLFNNWGRHQSVSERLRELQKQWDELRSTVNSYLSAALTANTKLIWPESEAKADLPEKIEDLVAISDITFRSSEGVPPISLTEQGSGAQSTILYQTHYMLDSDKTLHRGIYHPMWLMEEPETFLHADITAKLCNLLNSEEWLESIQMVVSTHSPIVLAGSRKNAGKVRWVVLEEYQIRLSVLSSDVTDHEIEVIASVMGDSNFGVYFNAAQSGPILYLEDSRPETANAIRALGISTVHPLNGAPEVEKYLNVLKALPQVVEGKAIFLIDNDSGAKSIKSLANATRKSVFCSGLSVLTITHNVLVIVLPQGMAVEDLYQKFQGFINNQYELLLDQDGKLLEKVPTELSKWSMVYARISPILGLKFWNALRSNKI